MHRPKKNKIHNPTLPEDQQDVVDERHLVDAQDSEDISFEDRASIYWSENKGFISASIFVLALVIIGFNGMRIYKNQAEAKIQAAYADARANDTLAEFAQTHPDKELGGLAALSLADEAYEAEDYERAINFYTIAGGALEGSILEGRALIGQAFARFYNGQKEDALAQLSDIAANTNLAEAARAEAAYHLAIEADLAGRSEEFDRYVAQIENSELAGQWQQRLAMYEQQAR
jgi:predicted negative regulator of RcsB-dependent stress response